MPKEVMLEEFKMEAKKKLKAWRSMARKLDWCAEFPDHEFITKEGQVNLMELLTVDVGQLYLKLETQTNTFGFIPILASSSYG